MWLHALVLIRAISSTESLGCGGSRTGGVLLKRLSISLVEGEERVRVSTALLLLASATLLPAGRCVAPMARSSILSTLWVILCPIFTEYTLGHGHLIICPLDLEVTQKEVWVYLSHLRKEEARVLQQVITHGEGGLVSDLDYSHF